MQVQHNYSLKAYNTFGIDVSCNYFAEVTSTEELKTLLADPQWKTQPRLILGGGSNLLFTGDFDGLVIKNSIKGIEVVKEDEAHTWLKAGGGEVWHNLVLHAIDKGLGGIENLSLIPGQVGAAPMQNIGAYGVELKDVFDSLEALHIESGELHTFNNEQCAFGYRESVFKNKYKGQYIITSVTLRLSKKPVFNTSYGAITDTLKEMGVEQLSIKAISDAVIHIRQSKLPNPAELGNAGSFFKNPVISRSAFEKLQLQNPTVPHYDQPDGSVKVPAGWLIEQAGWKGKKVGNTGSHAKQALVLVNYGNATGNEIYKLALDIQQSVKDQFGIDINPEVNIV